MNSADIYTIIFLVLAVFIFFRLRSVLGTRTGNERPPSDPYSRREAAPPPRPASNENVLTLPPRGDTRPPAVAAHGDVPGGVAPAPGGLDAVAAADPAFDPDQFIAGAKAAYEMITSAFAAGDRATLQPLLSHDVFDAFSQVIAERQSSGHRADTTLVSIDETSIGDAELRGTTAQITVRFVAKMANAVHDADGKLIEGSPDKIAEVTDLWTFARQVDARDPNWTLVATEIGLSVAGRILGAALIAALCAAPTGAWPAPAGRVAQRFTDLAGWRQADHRAAFAAFADVCGASVRPGQGSRLGRALGVPCAAARALAPRPNDAAARRFFETEFRPVEVGSPGRGFFTGYFEPEVAGALHRTARFSAPLLARPADLVSLPRGADLPGVAVSLTAARRLPGGRLMPYPDRAAIETGALGSRARALAWVDPIDAFFVQIQGSGRVRLRGGKVLSLGFAGRNGWPYTAVARLLVARGAMTLQEATAARLRAWLIAHPEQAPALMRENRSYIFFRVDAGRGGQDGPLGAAHVPLRAGVSIAVDHRIWPYGLPVWIEATLPIGRNGALAPFRRLTVAADTGSAIVGAARADIFFGAGDAAGAVAGRIKHRGHFVALVPRGVAP